MPVKAQTETSVHPLVKFTGELERTVNDRRLTEKQVVRQVSRHLQTLIRSRQDFLPPGATHTFEEKYGRHLLYRGKNKKFVVMSLVWGPGHGTPVHDHGTWGVAAVYKNELRVINYRKGPSSRNGAVRLIADEPIDGPAGSVTFVLPPREEIHKMENITGSPTISIHVYGREIKSCNTYNLETGAVKKFTLAPPAIYNFL